MIRHIWKIPARSSSSACYCHDSGNANGNTSADPRQNTFLCCAMCSIIYNALSLPGTWSPVNIFLQLNWYQEEDCKCVELGCPIDALVHILLFNLTISQHCTLTWLLTNAWKLLLNRWQSLMKGLKNKDGSSLKIIGVFFKYFEFSWCCSKIHQCLVFTQFHLKRWRDDKEIVHSYGRQSMEFVTASDSRKAFAEATCARTANSQWPQIWQTNYIWATKVHIYALFAHKVLDCILENQWSTSATMSMYKRTE